MKKDSIIEIGNLDYSYNEKDLVLDDISLDIQKGDLIAIIGPNGTGKSTLVKIICGLIKAKKGKIKVNGKVSYIPQKYNQDFNFPAKVKEILNLECCDCSFRSEVLRDIGAQNLEEMQFKNLSGGQQQKILIALSLLAESDILILDEPTVGIDTKTQEEFYKLLKKLNYERELTIIFVTHDTGMVSKYFNKIICLNNKKAYIDDAKNTHLIFHTVYGDNLKELHHHHHNHSEHSKGGQ